MNYIKYILSGLLLLGIISCTSEKFSHQPPQPESFGTAGEDAPVIDKQRQRTGYLAYVHWITVELPEGEIGQVFEKVISFCNDDTENKCTMLHSSLNTGQHAYSNIQIRILPQGVEPLLDLVSKQGNVSNRSTDIEDLQDAIVNNKKRLEMLLQYQTRLMELERKSGNDVDSLITITQELSQVQSDIEYSEGEKARLLQRVQMDIVNISLQTLSYTSFWRPISDSIVDFGKNLSEAISQVIVAIAYLLPWSVIVIFIIYVIRIVWRKTRAKKT